MYVCVYVGAGTCVYARVCVCVCVYFCVHRLLRVSVGAYGCLFAYTIFTNARARYDTRSIFKRSLTGVYSEFSFS